MATDRRTGQVASKSVLLAPDKFRGTLTAAEFVAVAATAAAHAGWESIAQPMADGGEGLVEAFGGTTHTTVVTGPHGKPVEAAWRLEGERAVIESAAASGLLLAGGKSGNDPLGATSLGTGELIVAAVAAGARQIIVGLGGSAMTDGGLAAVEIIDEQVGQVTEAGVDLIVACDVETVFTDAARVFGPQKGADPKQVAQLSERLIDVQEHYEQRFGTHLRDRGIDLATASGAGAAGGLGGGLLAIGGRLMSGLEVVAREVRLAEQMDRADAVVTGEGALDAESFKGKVVGGVTRLARERDLPVLIVAGTVEDGLPELPDAVQLVDLTAQFGREASWARTARCVEQSVESFCRSLS
ncbi:MAG TPA: glycerate kinase [Intrasporangiaceae bacterium]|nr:glycerate kinase [Intrasporangiaceae bacterium]